MNELKKTDYYTQNIESAIGSAKQFAKKWFTSSETKAIEIFENYNKESFPLFFKPKERIILIAKTSQALFELGPKNKKVQELIKILQKENESAQTMIDIYDKKEENITETNVVFSLQTTQTNEEPSDDSSNIDIDIQISIPKTTTQTTDEILDGTESGLIKEDFEEKKEENSTQKTPPLMQEDKENITETKNDSSNIDIDNQISIPKTTMQRTEEQIDWTEIKLTEEHIEEKKETTQQSISTPNGENKDVSEENMNDVPTQRTSPLMQEQKLTQEEKSFLKYQDFIEKEHILKEYLKTQSPDINILLTRYNDMLYSFNKIPTEATQYKDAELMMTNSTNRYQHFKEYFYN